MLVTDGRPHALPKGAVQRRHLERGWGYGTIRTGLELMVLPVALGFVAPWSGRMADQFGVRLPAVSGMALVTAGLVGLDLLHPSTAGFAGLMAVIGAGLGLFNSPNNAGIMAAAPPEQSGLASGLFNMARGMGTALGSAVTSTVFSGLGGDSYLASAVRTAFSGTVLVLAGFAAVAGAIAACGASPDPLAHRNRSPAATPTRVRGPTAA